MKHKYLKMLLGSMAIVMAAGVLTPGTVMAESAGEWKEENGKFFWYENGVKQGCDENNPDYRGKEIYDEASNAWYWLDNVEGGAKAVNKDVYQDSLAGIWGDYIGEDGQTYGKWVRYDENGHMIKGWSTNESGTYFFDYTYGTMAKGYATIDGKEYYFNEGTGVLERELGEVPEMGWKNIDGNDYWYEGYVRQGYSIDDSYRGKEIFDPETNAWYWLDNVDDGRKAVSKDVYQESLAGEWGDITGEDGQIYGKWVRYDENGYMIKGWSTTPEGTYYFDETYGTMAKGEAEIDGKSYFFNIDTGICEGESTKDETTDDETKDETVDDEITKDESEGEEEQISNTIKDEDVKYSGAIGDVVWKVSNDGLLLITGQCAEDGIIPKTYTFRYYNDSYEWQEYSLDITSAYVDVKGATDLSGLLKELYDLERVDLSHLDTSKVTDMNNMFYDCKSLKSLDVSNFKTENVTDMESMFARCESLSSLDLSSFDTGNVENMNDMFMDCTNLNTLDVSSFNTENVETMYRMFSGCENVTALDLKGFNTGKSEDMMGMFRGCSSLTSLDLSSFDTKNVERMEAMFEECSSLTALDLSGFDTGSATTMLNMFCGCENLESLDVSSFNTENVVHLSFMFAHCGKLNGLEMSGFNTQNTEFMSGMFWGCSSITNLDVSGFDTTKVSDMAYMFQDCSGLTTLDVSNFNTENVTGMSSMFDGCSGLSQLDISSFDTNKVEYMDYMFRECSSLTEILVGSMWELAENVESMFEECGTDHVTVKE